MYHAIEITSAREAGRTVSELSEAIRLFDL
jgi:hypothetical protein